MGNTKSNSKVIHDRIMKSYLENIKKTQINFFLKHRKMHIFRTKGFLHNSWKYNLLDELNQSNENNFTVKWKESMENFLCNSGFSEIGSQSSIFFKLLVLNLRKQKSKIK